MLIHIPEALGRWQQLNRQGSSLHGNGNGELMDFVTTSQNPSLSFSILHLGIYRKLFKHKNCKTIHFLD
jgi:hypothetical protein